MIEESKGPQKDTKRDNDPSQRIIKKGSLKTHRPNDESYEMSEEEFRIHQPLIMELFKANNKRKKAKAGLQAASKAYEHAKAEVKRLQAPIMRMFDETNSD
jgi:hypothetical protein